MSEGAGPPSRAGQQRRWVVWPVGVTASRQVQCCTAAAAAAQSGERGQRQVVDEVPRGLRCFHSLPAHGLSPIGALLRQVRARCLPCACPRTISAALQEPSRATARHLCGRPSTAMLANVQAATAVRVLESRRLARARRLPCQPPRWVPRRWWCVTPWVVSVRRSNQCLFRDVMMYSCHVPAGAAAGGARLYGPKWRIWRIGRLPPESVGLTPKLEGFSTSPLHSSQD